MSRPIDVIQWGYDQGIQYIDDLATLTDETITNRDRMLTIEAFLNGVDQSWPLYYAKTRAGDSKSIQVTPMDDLATVLQDHDRGVYTEINLMAGTHKITANVSLYNSSLRIKSVWGDTGDVILEFENGSLNISHGVVEIVGSSHGTFKISHNGGSPFFDNAVLNANASNSNYVVGGYANFTVEYLQNASSLYGNSGFINGTNSSVSLAYLYHVIGAGVDPATISIFNGLPKGLRAAYWGQTKPATMLYHGATSNVVNWL